MNQDRLNQAIDALTQAVGNNKPAADALQLLIADYYLAQAHIVDLNKTISALGTAAPLADVLRTTEVKRREALQRLSDISDQGKQILQDLSDAQQNVRVAVQKMNSVVQEYASLNANAQTLADSTKKLASGALKSFLGPFAEIGPAKDIATRLFG